MKLIILITLVETAALMLWMAYSYHKRGALKLQPAPAGKPSASTLNRRQTDPVSANLDRGRWSFINTWEVQDQHDDRPLMNGSVPSRRGAVPAVRRAFARQVHQLMYKKWSQERHD